MALNGFQDFEPFGQPAPLPQAHPEPGCNGVCLTHSDLGLPEYDGPGVVAYAHPDCPEHGDPVDDTQDTTYEAAPFDDPEDV